MSDFNSPIDRDMQIAARMGALAVRVELNAVEIGTYGSDRIRLDFRKGVLNRYYPETYKGSGAYADATVGWLRSVRADLNRAYYRQEEMINVINRKPEVIEIDGHAELVSA